MSQEETTEEERYLNDLRQAALLYTQAVLAKVIADTQDGDPDELASGEVKRTSSRLRTIARNLGIISLATDAAVADRTPYGRRAIRLNSHESGARERDALKHWWSCVEGPTKPLEEVTAVATYDPVLDAITWGGQSATIEQINRMERYGEGESSGPLRPLSGKV